MSRELTFGEFSREMDDIDAAIHEIDAAPQKDMAAGVSVLVRKRELAIAHPQHQAKRRAQKQFARDSARVRTESKLRLAYNEYIASPEWRSRRQVALRRAGYRCQVCNSPDQLQVHHRTYERFGAEMEDDLTVLCLDCHELYEKAKRVPERPGAA